MKPKTGLIFTVFLFIFALLVLTTCKKDNDDPNNNTSDTLQANVKLIDANISQLVSDSVQLSQGIYKFDFTGTPPVIAVGDVIVGAEGMGFLRKVTGVTSEGNSITFQTEEADMGDLFNNAKFSFQTGIPSSKTGLYQGVGAQNLKINYLAPGVKLSPDGFDYDFSNTIIYQGGGVTFKITNGSAHFNPNFIGEVEYFLGIPTKISCFTDKADLTVTCNLNLKATGSADILNWKKVIVDFDKPTIVIVCGIPVVIVAHTQLIATLNTNVDAAIDMTAGVTENYKLTLGAIWENGDWTGMYELTNNESFLPLAWTGNVHLGEKLVITPEVDFTFYGIVGPYFEPAMWERFGLGIALPSLDWDAKLSVGLDAKVGVVVKIFKKKLKPCDLPPYSTSVDLWKAPDTIRVISGNNQPGTPGQPLPAPIKVIVKDNLGNPRASVPVHFQVTQGGGSVAQASVTTNSGGYAETSWTLGPLTGAQVVNASIKNSAGQVIQSRDFTAAMAAEANSIAILSGDNQTGTLGQTLAQPIKVIVKDVSGNPFSGTKVKFAANNGGSVSASQVTTGADGTAGVTWTLGNTDPSQTVTVTAFKSDNTTHLQGSPLTFTASTSGILPIVKTDSITDITESSAIVWCTITNLEISHPYILDACIKTPSDPILCLYEQYSGPAYGVPFSGLIPNTTYTVRAHAMNDAGEVYGNILSFTTIDDDDTTTICGSGDYLSWWGSLDDDSKKAYNYTLGNGQVTTTPTDGEFITLCETTQMDLNGLGLSQLNGLDFFQNLTSLSCQANSLTSLDVSGSINLTSLDCSVNSLTSLDVSGCTNLYSLYCQANSLISIDISECTNLGDLDCSNNLFPSLDLSGYANLAILVCDNNLSLTSLDISGCTNLNSLRCVSNTSLTSLEVSGCINLTSVYCSSNSITSLDVSGYVNLTSLDCSYNSLTSLDVSGCTNLNSLNCEHNSLTILDVSSCTNLWGVNCSDNSLTSFNISDCTKLTYLKCSYNYLTILDVSGFANLEDLNCSNNQLTSLDVSGCANLSYLYCPFNRFTTLNVSGLINLAILDCSKNLLTSLDVSGHANLSILACSFNVLTSLDVSSCINLGTLSCNNNGFDYDALVAIITLHVPTLNWTCDNASSSNGPDPENPYIGSDCYLLNQLYDEIYGGE